MPTPPQRSDLAPNEKQYSIIKFDEWKAPTDPDFYHRITETDDLNDLPVTSIGRGESLSIYNGEGKVIASWDGPDDPTASDIPEL